MSPSAAGADGFALGGSINLNFVRDSQSAYISYTQGTVNPAVVTADGNVVVRAGDSSTIDSGAGAWRCPSAPRRARAAISTDDIANKVTAGIEGMTVTGNEVQVGTAENANIVNVTVAGSGATMFALALGVGQRHATTRLMPTSAPPRAPSSLA